jgi:DNA topoisomerase IA
LAKKRTWKVKDIKETEVKRAPRAPFITSTLQQAASTIWICPKLELWALLKNL